MGVLIESWCFCNGGAKSERTKAAIFSGKGPATANISGGGGVSGTGFMIHRNLLLTTHANLPSVAASEAAEIRLQSGVGASLFPHRFFISSSVLDLTVVGVDVDGDSNTQPHYLKTCSKPNLELGNVVYVLGYNEKNELAVGEGKVVIATDNLIKLSTNGLTLSPGSAGFDVHGNLAFMVCDPMKLATSPNTKSKSTSTSSSSSMSSKKDLPLQFAIPMPIICDWLKQHWEGNLDELNKPKLPLIRLMSGGQKSDHSCASFTMKRVFKSAESGDVGTQSSSSKMKDGFDEETITRNAHLQGIPTPEIYESPKVTSFPVRKKDPSPIQLLDINFPPKLANPPVLPQPIKKLAPFSDENHVKGHLPSQEDERELGSEVASTGSVTGPHNEAQSSSSPIEILEEQIECSSEGETTMYSAETAESRNYPSPREGRSQQVGRSQSCVNYNRYGATQRHPLARKAVLDKQRSFMRGGKTHSQGTNSQRSNNDFYGPTVSSIMKKRINSEQLNKPRPSVVCSSSPKGRWMF